MAKVLKLTKDGRIPNFRDVTMGMYRTGVVELSEKKREGRFFYQMIQGYISDDMYDMIMEYGIPRIYIHLGVAEESNPGFKSENDGKKKVVFEVQVDVPEDFTLNKD